MTYIANIMRSEGDPEILRTGPSSMGASDRLGKALGWFSIGLGLTELIAPGAVTRFLGMQGKEGLVQAYGVREIGAGMMCLSTEKNMGLWSRVAGDGLDMATLLPGLRADNPKRNNVVVALATVAAITLLDIAAAQGTRCDTGGRAGSTAPISTAAASRRACRLRVARPRASSFRAAGGSRRSPHDSRSRPADRLRPE